jgi:TRAP-type C4-dicarboxylate transport system substrate-binding protein
LKKTIIIIIVAIVLITAVAFTGCAPSGPSPEKPIELKFSYWPPPVDPWVQQGILPWGPEIEKKTNGRVKVTYFGGSSLGAPPDHLDLVQKGTADIGWINPAFTPGVFPLTDIRNLPFLYPTTEAANKIFWKQQELLDDWEYKDKIKVLWTFATPPMEVHSNKVQIKTLEDLAGQKFGDTEPTAGAVSEALGAVPVILMETELYTGLERGMLDGRWQEWHGLMVWKTGEVTKYRTENVRIMVHQNIIGMNLDVYNNLPNDIKKVIDDTTGWERSAAAGEIWEALNQETKQIILDMDKKKGNPPPISITDAERERWVKAAQPVIDNWLKEMEEKGLGAEAKELLDKTRQWAVEFAE